MDNLISFSLGKEYEYKRKIRSTGPIFSANVQADIPLKLNQYVKLLVDNKIYNKNDKKIDADPAHIYFEITGLSSSIEEGITAEFTQVGYFAAKLNYKKLSINDMGELLKTAEIVYSLTEKEIKYITESSCWT